MIRSLTGFIDAVIELVDLRYRPEVNTIGGLAEADPSEHVPFAEPIWTTTPEESGLGFVAQQKFEFVSFVGVARVRPAGGATITCSTTWQNGSQAQHIRACEQSKGDARGYIWIRPVVNGLLWQVLL